jgi:hypothetical protein
LLGAFRENIHTRAEFMAMIGSPASRVYG